ncbi:MAG: ABC transporter ATP-binding protein [Chromatiales bacterium]|nr:ABC transporter ATP-binding protein [Chromatiales bacterium]
MLKIDRVFKSYREAAQRHQILGGIDLEVNAGESIAIVGRSGCGKTTLLNLMAGLDLPDSGSVQLANRDLVGMSDKERTLLRRRQIGMVFQFFNLLPTLTVLENILLPLELLGLQDEREAVITRLQALGLTEQQHRFPEQLSGGELQRVAILRAMAHRPKLLLADEPTGNLDHETGNQVADILFESVGEDAASLIVVTHSSEVAAKADRVYHLQDGLLSQVS